MPYNGKLSTMDAPVACQALSRRTREPKGVKGTIVAHRGFPRILTLLPAVLVGAALAGPGAVPAAAVEAGPRLANGIRITVHTPQALEAEGIVQEADGPVLIHPSVGRVPLCGDAGRMTPFDEAVVRQAVQDLSGFFAAVDVEIFILPATPREVPGSFARRGAILLAPGTGPVDPITASSIVTHEMGHVLTWARLDGAPARWDTYLDLRGLDPAVNGPQASHADRAREILAEDIRFLFGGPLATASGTIENHTLTTPDRVPGLAAMLARFLAEPPTGLVTVAGYAFPNPCNPLTTVEMTLPWDWDKDRTLAQAEPVLRIYDVRGALVRTVAGGRVANGRAAACWDGTDGGGTAAASGHYIYVMTLDRLTARGSVTLIR